MTISKSFLMCVLMIGIMPQTHCGWFDWAVSTAQQSKGAIAILAGLSAFAWYETSNVKAFQKEKKEIEDLENNWNSTVIDSVKRDIELINTLQTMNENACCTNDDEPIVLKQYYERKKHYIDASDHFYAYNPLSLKNALLALEKDNLYTYDAKESSKHNGRYAKVDSITDRLNNFTWDSIKLMLMQISNMTDVEQLIYKQNPEAAIAQQYVRQQNEIREIIRARSSYIFSSKLKFNAKDFSQQNGGHYNIISSHERLFYDRRNLSDEKQDNIVHFLNNYAAINDEFKNEAEDIKYTHQNIPATKAYYKDCIENIYARDSVGLFIALFGGIAWLCNKYDIRF